MKVALVYDRVNKIGGAERVLETLHEIWPKAPLYTAVYYSPGAPWAKEFKVIPSFLNRFPLARKHHEAYPWLTPMAFENFDFSNFDLVISVTSAEAKGIITKPKTRHLCYCLTPTRYLWSGYENYFKNRSFRFLSKPIVNYLKQWDKIAAQRPDTYLAISQTVKKRIKKYYQRDSQIIYPPVDTEKFQISQKRNIKSDFFLVVSRLVPYKKIDLVVKAFNQLNLPLKIIGTGSQMGKLKRMAKTNIQFLGQLTDKELLSYYQTCRALIFPQEEDFGLVPLEAQACGKPVIAFAAGGALETVIEGKTGTFFKPQETKALVKKIKAFKDKDYQAADCRTNAEKFSKIIFKENFKKLVEKTI
jgi:glycosyltransferase involved in cell wall biosynthesis